MPVSINNTTLTFNDASTQTTSAVTAVNVGTGISSTGGKTPTLTNTGVTSIVAGTGITISGGTGAVTVNSAGISSANCTYTGSLVESGAIATGNGGLGGFGTFDLGSNRVVSGVRNQADGPNIAIWLRGYNLRNN